MDISRLSKRYTVRPVGDSDVPRVLALCQSNPLYFRHCPPMATEESIRGDRAALPPGVPPEHKHYVGYFDGETLVAVADILEGYPCEKTAWIGFLMVDSAFHRRGVGTGIVKELCEYLKQQGFHAVSLGWMRGNGQAEGFWRHSGFAPTGKEAACDGGTVVQASRQL